MPALWKRLRTAAVTLGAVVVVVPAVLLAQSPGDTDGPLLPNHDTVRSHPLTNDTIVRMSKAGLDDMVILRAIQNSSAAFDVGPEDLITLMSAGVSSRVMEGMQAKAAGLAVRLPDGSDGRTQLTASNVPKMDEIGVYYKDKKGYWIPLKTERVTMKSGGWVKSTVTYGIIKQDKNGQVDGPHSPLTLAPGTQILFFVPDGTLPAEYAFVRFREHPERREFRIYTGGVFHNESGSDRDALDFDAERIAPRTYGFTLPEDMENGEYGMLPPGSSNVPGFNGTGKIFTFRIVDGHAPKKS